MTSNQLKTARALIGWKRERLAKASGVSVATLARLERDDRSARHCTFAMIRVALEAAGIESTDGEVPGAKLRRAEP